MKQPGLILLIFLTFWQFTIAPATAQDDPYHCDSLKVICFDDAKIQVRYFNAPKTCPATCTFCAAIETQDWLTVKDHLKKEVKTLSVSAENLEDLRSRLLRHRLVNFVLPPETPTQAELPAYLRIGFQAPHMTYSWVVSFKQKKAGKANPASWKLSNFESDSHIYSRLNDMGANFQMLLKSDSLKMPAPWLPLHNDLAAWFGTRTPAERAALEQQIRENPRNAVRFFIANKYGIGLVMLLAHENLHVRYLALQGIITIRDKNCLPYLLYLAERTRTHVETSPDTETLYMNYCEQLVSAIGMLTNCSFNRCPFAHYPPQHYLQLGLPTWERKIEPLGGQGIGMYGVELNGR